MIAAATATAGFDPPAVAVLEAPPAPEFDSSLPLSGDMSPMSPGQNNGSFPRAELTSQLPGPDGGRHDFSESGASLEMPPHQAADL